MRNSVDYAERGIEWLVGVNFDSDEIYCYQIDTYRYKPKKFKLTFADFEMSKTGSIQHLPIGEGGEYGLTRWISASPNYVELAPGERKKIAVNINLPDEEAAYKAAWCVLMVDEAKERQAFDPKDLEKDKMVMGVIPTMGFGVYIYQNPPNVKINKVEIVSFTFNYDDKNRYVHLRCRNTGDGIGYCKSYVELSNFNTGKVERLPLRRFNVMPTQERLFEFILPGAIEKGKYSVVGVLDFGSEEELEAAEMEITVE